jgi:hypothetical protein
VAYGCAAFRQKKKAQTLYICRKAYLSATMDILLAFLAASFILVGFFGSILPVLPGPPLSWIGLLLLHFSRFADFSTRFLAVSFVVMAVIAALDYFIPIWGAKRFGGTRSGVIGSTVGLIIGLFFMPLGVVAGPFLGALIGELLHAPNERKRALKSAIGSFIGFLLGTGLKLVFCAWAIATWLSAVVPFE